MKTFNKLFNRINLAEFAFNTLKYSFLVLIAVTLIAVTFSAFNDVNLLNRAF